MRYQVIEYYTGEVLCEFNKIELVKRAILTFKWLKGYVLDVYDTVDGRHIDRKELGL